MRTRILLSVSILIVTLASLRAADSVLITEFLTSNTATNTGYKDEDGDLGDWIEIHNVGGTAVNLNGWFLTDAANNLQKWSFPATNIGPNGYIVVFADNKNRRVPGAVLHTNFKLDNNGEYLALVMPDGVTVASSFAPKYPVQVDRVSYGFPAVQNATTLIDTGAVAKVYIPTNDVLGANWLQPEFDDSAWLDVVTGVGYETDPSGPFVPVAIADSVSEFSGKQGSNNWYYGYWDRRADPNGVYSDLDMSFFPNADEAYGSNNFWNGTAWTWFNGNPPFTQLTAQGGVPNASNGIPTRADHWTVRRYVSEVSGSVQITGNLTHTSEWVYVTATGLAANSLIYVYLTAAGDGYIDDMKLVLGSVPEAGPNLLPNGDFESPLTGPWTVSPNHAASAIVTSVKHGGNSSLHLVADAGGTTQGSAIWQTIAPALDTTTNYTLSYWFKPGTAPVAPLTVRFSGSWINTTPPSTCGDGVLARIFVDGNQVFQQVAFNSSNNYNLTTTVNLGSRIDFVLDPRANDFCDAAAFTAHVETADPGNLAALISSNIQSAMKDVNSCAYLRIPFVVNNPAEINFLSLSMKYDDGFVAYLNGVNVASRNAIDFQNPLTWNSVATANRVDSDVNVFSGFDITSFAGLLHTGTNVLAIHGLNASAGDSDFLLLPVLQALKVVSGTNGAYFATPTPGAANGLGSTNLGPIVSDATHTPNVPLDNENLTVTAAVAPTFYAISNVLMTYRVAYSNEVTTPMFDDGLHGDGAAGDGVYGAIIPASAANPGQMIRYYVAATDTRTNRTRMPAFVNATNSPEYFGTIVSLSQTNSLPLFHWFIVNPAAAISDTGTRCSFFYNGQFFDNVGVTLHGQSSAGFPKHSYNFNLNSGYKLEISPDKPKLGDFALISTWADRTHVRIPINTEAYQNAGVPAHYTFPLRVQQNESFFCVVNFSEQGNDKYLERIGYDPDGALYKMYNTFTGAAGNEKKTRKYEGTADLQNFYNAIIVGGTAALTYIYDNVNLPSMVDFLAVKTVTSDHDCCHKNYYFYRDSNKSGEWFGLPWDFDLSLAHVWTSGNGNYFDDTTYTNLFVGVGNNNTIFAIMWADPALKAMWMRRTRTLMDQMLQPAGTPATADVFRARFDYFANQVRADATLDKAKWGGAAWTVPVSGPANPTTANLTNNFEIELSRVKDFYLPGRRTFLATQVPSLIPTAQSSNLFITIGAIDYNPANANQAQEYVELINTNTVAVDLSGWRLKGGIDFTFPPGTVVSAATAGVTNRIYVSPEVKAFRARTTGPRGGQRLVVLGGYSGQLSARGETLVLVNPAGQTNASLTYAGAPSLAQQYLRITEIMYHPPDPGVGSLYGREEFEYLELKNIGPVALNLNGIHFTNGITLTFSSANVTNLNPGERLILAKNPAAFASRYPGVTNVVVAYLDTLENNGESIRLDDAVGEKILDFAYNNSWYPLTDGDGLSLVIVNESAPFNTWGDKESWRPSTDYLGTPGGGDAAPLTFAPILVNEVLSHTAFPALDVIELYNPTTNDVDIGNWLISDDFFTPKKFRIPGGTMIPAGGFRVFDETAFNVGPGGFSFSAKGDEAYLFSGDASGNPNGYYHGFGFDGAPDGVSFGRHTNSQGDIHFVAQSSNTLGAANVLPRVGPIVFSEIMYRPPDLVTATNVLDNSDDEYVELQNLTTNAVPLYDPAFPTNRWRIQDGIGFTFSTNDVIPANGFLVVANFNPTNAALLAAFRAKYGVPAEVSVVGPYSGQLNNGGEKIELYRPDAPDVSGTGFILVERVHYLNTSPWDVTADGLGASLHRRVPGDYGNDPTNWIAASPSPGAAYAGGTAPVITQQPANAEPFIFGTTNFTASVSGSGVRYQWLFNSNVIAGATNTTLTLANIQFSQGGAYRFLAYNGGGSVISSNAQLIVRIPVFFSVQPTNQNVLPGTNVTLVALAIGNGPVRYQWRFEGTNIPNATNTSYSFTGASLTNHGNYTVLATDNLGSAVSSNANIFVLIKPGIVTHIVGQTVLQGGTAIYSVVATGAPPLWYRWIRNGSGIFTSTVPVLMLTNVQASATIRCVVTNVASPAGVFSPATLTVPLTVLADFDHDGIADLWEAAYFGNASTNDASNALLDPDGDGMNNRDEYLAGTNPTNALSVLKIVLTATNGNVLQFLAQSNITYSVQRRTNFLPAVWVNLTNITGQTGVRTIIVDTAQGPPSSERYYRVVTPLVP